MNEGEAAIERQRTKRKQREPEGGEDLAGNAEPAAAQAAVEERGTMITGNRNGSRAEPPSVV